MGGRDVTVAGQKLDREKIRTAVRKLGDESVFYMLSEALDLLPQTKLLKLVRRYLDPSRLQPDGKPKGTLLADVKAFQKAGLGGEYYESFNVNSKNCTVISKGTRAWISDCHRLLDRCVRQAKKGNQAEVCQSFDIIFELLDHIDECREDVIFFADEAGSWQVGVDWEKVLPAWFKALSATVGPKEYAGRIIGLLDRHYHYRRNPMLAVAQKVATPAQRKAFTGP
jgi:hypothetical protein